MVVWEWLVLIFFVGMAFGIFIAHPLFPVYRKINHINKERERDRNEY